ncbi:hypothetical protein DJ031_06760 [bacterium endosymbiont of Escarpia laminata]|nr:MAG: hypothetical protein DJ031_06760 [bacterium endosymbiont of Escarpia laminata]
MEQLNGIQAAIEAGKALGTHAITDVEGVPTLIVPEGFTAKQYPDLMEHPKRTEQVVRTDTAGSFIEYFNRFGDDNSAIFCDLEDAYFLGIIDYHSEDHAKWLNHQVKFTCKQTPEWSAWERGSGQRMDQLKFAFFIEENLEEIINPPGAEMLEIATTLKAKTKINFTSAQRLDNGQTQFQYVEEIDGSAGIKGQISIPETIKLGMRLFEGGDAYEMEARFRYRIKEGQVAMWYDLVRPHKVHRAAVDSVFEQIKKQAKCQLIIHGST